MSLSFWHCPSVRWGLPSCCRSGVRQRCRNLTAARGIGLWGQRNRQVHRYPSQTKHGWLGNPRYKWQFSWENHLWMGDFLRACKFKGFDWQGKPQIGSSFLATQRHKTDRIAQETRGLPFPFLVFTGQWSNIVGIFFQDTHLMAEASVRKSRAKYRWQQKQQ